MEDSVKQTIQTYDKYAKVYADYTSEKLFQYQLNKFISLIKKSPKVLDAGCGAGRDSEYLAEEDCEVIGIDLSEGLLKEARERAPKAKLQKMDFTQTSFKSEEFDGIWCMASLCDIPKKETSEALKEFNRVLKKEGIVYIAVKKGEGEKIIMKKLYENNPRFYSFFMEKEIEDLIKSSNFGIISSTTTDDDGTEWIEIFARKL